MSIGDTVETVGPRPYQRNFANAELDTMMGLEGNHLQRGIARALETLAAEWATEARRQRLGPASSQGQQAEAHHSFGIEGPGNTAK